MRDKNEVNRPVYSVRLGKLKAAVWANTSNGSTFYSITMTRVYRDNKGDYHDADNFGVEDLAGIRVLATEVERWYFDQAQRPQTEEAEQHEAV